MNTTFKIYMQCPKPGDIILIKVNTDKIPFEKAYNYCKEVIEKFPNNQVIFVPTNIDLKFTEWEQLRDFVESIKPKGEIK